MHWETDPKLSFVVSYVSTFEFDWHLLNLPSSCTAFSQAYRVNWFRRSISDERSEPLDQKRLIALQSYHLYFYGEHINLPLSKQFHHIPVSWYLISLSHCLKMFLEDKNKRKKLLRHLNQLLRRNSVNVYLQFTCNMVKVAHPAMQCWCVWSS